MSSHDSWYRKSSDNDEEEEEILLSEMGEQNDQSPLLEPGSNTLPRMRFSQPTTSQHSKVSERQREERKYKYSLVSVLVIGICLLLMVSIGLGYRKCEVDSGPAKPTAAGHKQAVCLDNATKFPFPWQGYRLPTVILPLEYDIFLQPNITTQKCTGEVTMTLEVSESTHDIILHSATTLKIIDVSYSTENGKIKPVQTMYCVKKEMLAFRFEKALDSGMVYKLKINFSYDLVFGLEGFYLSRYKKSTGEDMLIATTQFEPTSARAAFPCFDEPAFKVNVSLSLVREKQYNTLFNMPLSLSKPYANGDLVIDIFPPTPKMSSYLIAFVVSDFEDVSSYSKSRVKVSVFASHDKVGQLDFALTTAVKVLDFYEDFFKIPFPLPKMDLVAIPDFSAGAMENWGLITYRETAILYDPLTSSISDQEWVTIVIAHEISHQWFGNLVTMDWWNDLWLNEGFASFMEYFGSNGVYPEWHMMDEYPLAHVYRAMSTDVSRHTHPISVTVTNSAEISEIFDDISYSKGGSLISMLKDYFGKFFFEGVNTYLRQHAYGNANNKDLIKAVADAALPKTVDIQAMMDTWTTAPGFPIVTVTKADNGKIKIEQQRFLYSIGKQDTTSLGTIWQIPLSYITDINPKTINHHLLVKQSTFVDADFNSWIKFNHNEAGYYLVTYEKSIWTSLSKQLQKDHTIFTPNDRVGLIGDAFAAAHTGQLSYADVFEMIQFIKKETNYVVFVKALSSLFNIKNILKFQLDEKTHKKMNGFIAYLLQPMYDKISWKDDKGLDRQQAKLQAKITTSMRKCDYVPCINVALSEYEKWVSNDTGVNPDDLPAIFGAAVTHGSITNWDYLWSFFVNSTDANLKRKILAALTSTVDVEKILFLQSQVLKAETIRPQDSSTAIGGLSGNLVGASLTWKFVRQNWDELIKTNPITGFGLRRILQACLGTLSDASEVTAAEMFLKSKGLADMKYIKRNLEAVHINLYWIENHLGSVKLWLNNNEKVWSP